MEVHHVAATPYPIQSMAAVARERYVRGGGGRMRIASASSSVLRWPWGVWAGLMRSVPARCVKGALHLISTSATGTLPRQDPPSRQSCLHRPAIQPSSHPAIQPRHVRALAPRVIPSRWVLREWEMRGQETAEGTLKAHRAETRCGGGWRWLLDLPRTWLVTMLHLSPSGRCDLSDRRESHHRSWMQGTENAPAGNTAPALPDASRSAAAAAAAAARAIPILSCARHAGGRRWGLRVSHVGGARRQPQSPGAR